MKVRLSFPTQASVFRLFNYLPGVALISLATVAQGVVGYINYPISTGDNLVANQLDNGLNTLNSLYSSSTASAFVPNGTSFTKWDSAAATFLPVSYYNASLDQWSINYSLSFGEGGLLHSPGPTWTNTYVGSVFSGYNILTEVLTWNPNYAPGLHLISSPIPLSGTVSNMFSKIVGRAPRGGESVSVLDPLAQTYTTATYNAGSGLWDSNPTIGVAQSAWVNIVAVPEPTVASTLLVAGAAFAAFRRLRR